MSEGPPTEKQMTAEELLKHFPHAQTLIEAVESNQCTCTITGVYLANGGWGFHIDIDGPEEKTKDLWDKLQAVPVPDGTSFKIIPPEE